MDYRAYLFLNHLPHIEQETRCIDGVEQVCLIVPTKKNQLRRGRQGNWILSIQLIGEPPNEKSMTHTARLNYLNWDEYDKAKAQGYYKRSLNLGRVYPLPDDPKRTIDRTNRATSIRCNGVIVLSDIPKRLIFRNDENDLRYIQNLVFRRCSDDNVKYTGTICIDDIPFNRILTDPETGKKYIKVRFEKMKYLDLYMNTHQLVIDADDAEIEIGKFKEWRREGMPVEAQPRRDEDGEVHNTTITPRPTPKSIDGISF